MEKKSSFSSFSPLFPSLYRPSLCLNWQSIQIPNFIGCCELVLLKVGAEVEEVDVLEPSIAGQDMILETIRVAREINNLNNNQENEINKTQAPAEKSDQDAQSTDKSDQKAEAAESPAFDELTLDSIEDDKSHDKRFVSIVDLAVNFLSPN